MFFCSNNSSLSTTWEEGGPGKCFLDTLTSSLLVGFCFVFGSFQLAIYKKYSSRVDPVFIPKVGFFFFLQLFLSCLLIVEAVAYLFVDTYILHDSKVYGVSVLHCVSGILTWLLSLALILVERRRMLPSVPTRGHGIVLLITWTLALLGETSKVFGWKSSSWFWSRKTNEQQMQFGFFVWRYSCIFFMFVVGIQAPGVPGNRPQRNGDSESETQPLLTRIPATDASRSAWANFWPKLKALWPFLWPKGKGTLQFRVFTCFFLLGLGRVVNLYLPIFNKYIIDSLTYTTPAGLFSSSALAWRWDLIVGYVGLRLLQGGGTGTQGLLNSARTLLWIRVQQYTSREIQTELYTHLHHLSLRWHLGRKTGEVLRVMDRGNNSITSLLSYILFQIAPTMVDIVIAVVYFTAYFNIWFGLLVFTTMALYLAATILVTEWRTKFRRQMNLKDNKSRAIGVDSLLNFETVKYYNAEDYEVARYRESIVEYQGAEWESSATLCLLNVVQNIVICAGLLAGQLYCAWKVVHSTNGDFTVGDFVLFASYILQLYTPLNFLGTYYRAIQQAFVDMENMFDLLAEKREVCDEPDAPPLRLEHGAVRFNDVHFSYDSRKEILKGVSFTVNPGKTLALVGPSGSGKSTIVRLIFRFYDVQSGSIEVDGQDISKVTQNSLRRQIGVVPQDTVLFNQNIRFNIGYGNVNASDSAIESAAVSADIHEKILTFPDGYETMVGERGLKLSGGEKQRVAIARTILKSPSIVLLDEATSALDTQTERNIQQSLSEVCKNRTTITVAHRLSTVINADEILVLKDGVVAERGRHGELLERGGVYFQMWQQQQDEADKSVSINDPDV